VLTRQLGELEAAGLVYRKVYAEIPMRVEYFLTEVGESVYPVIQAMDKWSKAHQSLLDHSAVPDASE
jgi:DNA-binding HxlR family transcriptional regulator